MSGSAPWAWKRTLRATTMVEAQGQPGPSNVLPPQGFVMAFGRDMFCGARKGTKMEGS